MKTLTNETEEIALDARRNFFTWARARVVLYWIFTLPVAFEMAAGGVWDLLEIEYVRVVLAHLGYPQYLLIILGVWKIPCALVLLLPHFPRLKEWAYAGAFFTYSGAVASHAFRGDGAELLTPPLVLGMLTLVSYALRPPEHREMLAGRTPENENKILAWAVPILILAVFLILSFLTLPQGPPPALAGS